MQLYLLVWEFMTPDMECEWTHFVSDKPYISTEEEREIVAQFMRDNHEQEPDDYEIDNIWCNKVDMVDGYSIILKSF